MTTGVGDFGETDFLLDGRSIGHTHGGAIADIPFPRRLREDEVDDLLRAVRRPDPEDGAPVTA